MLYNVYYPVNNELNSNCDRNKYEYEKVLEMGGTSIRDIYYNLQKSFNPSLTIRSCAIGDIIEHKKIYYMVNALGFSEVPRAMLRFRETLNKIKPNQHVNYQFQNRKKII